MTGIWRAAGATVFVGGISVGAWIFEDRMAPVTDTPAGEDLRAAADLVATDPDPRGAAARLVARDETMAFLLGLDLTGMPPAARAPLAAASLPADVQEALVVATDRTPTQLAHGLWAPAEDLDLATEAQSALGALLDAEDEPLARGAATVACQLGSGAVTVADAAPRATVRGRALALVVATCGRSPEVAETALLAHLSPDDPLGPVAALELARLGRPSAIGALQAAAAANPRTLFGLAATYGVVTLSTISTTATHPSPDR